MGKRIKAKELKELVNKIDDEATLTFYIWDYEYDDEDPDDIGVGTLINIDKDNYINIGLHK